MERQVAIDALSALIGSDLRMIAESLGVTVEANGRVNKGWAGHTIERILGLAQNSAREPNFGTWELKVVPVRARGNALVVKETMAITMLHAEDVVSAPFEDSHLLAKLRKVVVVARTFEGVRESTSILHSVSRFDLDNPPIYAQVRADYEEVQETIRALGYDALSGRMGVLVQPRTKGAGHGSESRAFYARKQFVAHILGITPLAEYQVPVVPDTARLPDDDNENDL